jgi:hypothetical protein
VKANSGDCTNGGKWVKDATSKATACTIAPQSRGKILSCEQGGTNGITVFDGGSFAIKYSTTRDASGNITDCKTSRQTRVGNSGWSGPPATSNAAAITSWDCSNLPAIAGYTQAPFAKGMCNALPTELVRLSCNQDYTPNLGVNRCAATTRKGDSQPPKTWNGDPTDPAVNGALTT